MRRLLRADATSNQQMYRSRLRGIGGVLDARGCHAMAVVEVEGGILVRASSKGSRHPEILEFVDGEALPEVQLDPRIEVRRRLFPGGYAPFLEALGERLDRREATSISIIEGTDFVTVGGFVPIPLGGDEVGYEALDLLLLPEDILQLVERGIEPESRPEAKAANGRAPSPSPSRATSTGPGAAGVIAASFARVFGLARPQTFRLRS